MSPLVQQSNARIIGETSDDQFQPPHELHFATIPVYNVEAKYQVRSSEGTQTFQAGQQVQWFHYCFHSWSSNQQPPVRCWAVYPAWVHVNSVFVTEKVSGDASDHLHRFPLEVEWSKRDIAGYWGHHRGKGKL